MHVEQGGLAALPWAHLTTVAAVAPARVPAVATSTLVLLIFAIVLGLFGVAFAALGLSNERAYWSQRDPSGDSRAEATHLGTIIRRAGKLAVGEVRAPLRVAAIGVLMCYLALGFGVIALLTAVL